MKFSIKDFFSKCDQIRRKMRIWSHLLKKFLMENFIFCAVLKFRVVPLNFDSEKFLYLLKCKICGEVSYIGKAETKFRYRFNNYKVNTERLERVMGNFLRNYFTITSTGTTAMKIRIL